MADNSNFLQNLKDLFTKFAFGQSTLKNLAGPAQPQSPPVGTVTPPQNPAYLQGAVDQYMKQQQAQKAQQQLNHQKQQLRQQGNQPPAAPPQGVPQQGQPQGQGQPSGAPQAQQDTSSPIMGLFQQLMGKLA